jgi:hypothetical protein
LFLSILRTWSFVIFLKTFFWAIMLTFSWVCCHSHFECVVTRLLSVLSLLLLIGLTAHFCKGPSSTSIKTFFLNISAQPQLLKVEGPGDVGIIKTVLRYILCSWFIFTFFSHISLIAIFLWELNWFKSYFAAITFEH